MGKPTSREPIVADCEKTLAVLQDKRVKLVEKGAALDQQRRNAAFDAEFCDQLNDTPTAKRLTTFL
jgi:hypothetical protein